MLGKTTLYLGFCFADQAAETRVFWSFHTLIGK